MKKKNIRKSPTHSVYWSLLGKTYLTSAEILLHELLEKSYKSSLNVYSQIWLYGDDETQKIPHIILTINYLIKVAIELHLKGLGVKIDRNYWFNNHSLKDLLEYLKEKVEEMEIKASVFERIEKTINKYYSNELLGSSIPDESNILSRYPSDFEEYIKISRKLSALTESDFNDILEDIRNLEEDYNEIAKAIAKTNWEEERQFGR